MRHVRRVMRKLVLSLTMAIALHSCARTDLRAVNGQPCATNGNCYNVCIHSVCASQSSQGGPCDETADCRGGHVCVGEKCSVTPSALTTFGVPSGKIYVCGGAQHYDNALVPNGIWRLNADGTPDPTFNMSGYGLNNGCDYAAPEIDTSGNPTGRIYVVGTFQGYNTDGIPHDIMRINMDGSRDTTFNAVGGAAGGYDCGAHFFRQEIGANGLPDGRILVASGNFFVSPHKYNDVNVSMNLNRLNQDGSSDASFNSGGGGFDDAVWTLVQELATDTGLPTGRFIIGGQFTRYNDRDGDHVQPGLMRLNADGTYDAGFNGGSASPGLTNAIVRAILIELTPAGLPTGSYIVGGDDNVGPQWVFNGVTATSNGLIRVNSAGALDGTYNASGSGFPPNNAFVEGLIQELGPSGLPTGKIFVLNHDFQYNGVDVPQAIMRVNADGSFDPTFNGSGAGYAGGWVGAAINLVDRNDAPTGSLLVCGADYQSPNTQYDAATNVPAYLSALDSSGELDTSFNSGGAGLLGGNATIGPGAFAKVAFQERITNAFQAYASPLEFVASSGNNPITLTFYNGTPASCTISGVVDASTGACTCSGSTCTFNLAPGTPRTGSFAYSAQSTTGENTAATVIFRVRDFANAYFQTIVTHLNNVIAGGHGTMTVTQPAVGLAVAYAEWGGAVVSPASGGRYVYGIPSSGTSFLKIDTSNDTVTKISFNSAWQSGSSIGDWEGGVYEPYDGMIYAVPSYTASGAGMGMFLRLDPSTDAVTQVGVNVGAATGQLDQQNFCGGVVYNLLWNYPIYVAPGAHNEILKFDPSNPGVPTYLPVPGASATYPGCQWNGGVLAPNGSIYFVPESNLNSMLKISPADNDSITLIDVGDSGWSGAVLGPNGLIYGIPNFVDTVLEFDPTTDTVRSLIATPFTGDFSGGKYSGGALGADGKIYAAPSGSVIAGAQVSPLLIIDPAAHTAVTSGDYPQDTMAFKWRGAVSAPNGKVYAIPNAMQPPDAKLIVIDPHVAQTFAPDVCWSPYYNHY